MNVLLDYIPLIIFFYFYKTVDPKDSQHPLLQAIGSHGNVDQNHILVATFALLISTLVVYGALFVYQKFKLEKQQWFIIVMTVVFGSLTLAFSDANFIKFKAILINLGFAAAFLVSPFFGKERKPLIQRLWGGFFDLSHAAWKKYNWSWVIFFVFMAGLHFFFGFLLMNGKYWGEFTAFGDMIVMLCFLAAQLCFLYKHLKKS